MALSRVGDGNPGVHRPHSRRPLVVGKGFPIASGVPADVVRGAVSNVRTPNFRTIPPAPLTTETFQLAIEEGRAFRPLEDAPSLLCASRRIRRLGRFFFSSVGSWMFRVALGSEDPKLRDAARSVAPRPTLPNGLRSLEIGSVA